MSTKPKQIRTRPRKKLEDRRSITALLVYEILKRQPRGANDLKPDDPALLEAAQELAAIQGQAHRHELSTEDWKPSKMRNAKIAGALRTLTEELPSLNEEMEWAASCASNTGNVVLRMIFEDARRAVVDLTTSTNKFSANELLARPISRIDIPAKWELYATRIIGAIRKYLPQFSTEACYRILADLIPDITGEIPEDAVTIKKQYLTKVVTGNLKIRASKPDTNERS